MLEVIIKFIANCYGASEGLANDICRNNTSWTPSKTSKGKYIGCNCMVNVLQIFYNFHRDSILLCNTGMFYFSCFLLVVQRILMSPLRPLQCPMDLYKAPAPCTGPLAFPEAEKHHIILMIY